MKTLFSSVIAGALALVIAAPAQAQYPVEIGMDGGLIWTSPDVDGMDSTLDAALPFQYVRAGFFINDHFSIEPALGFDRQDFGDDFTLTQLSLLASGLYHFSPSRTQPQFYLQLAGGLGYISLSDDTDRESDTQWALGFGGGVKLPRMNRLAARLGVVYLRHFESDFMPDANQIRGQVGLSFYTR